VNRLSGLNERAGGRLRLAAPITGIAFLCGCYSASLSRAFVDPTTGWSSEVSGRAQRIVGPNIDIYVKTSNRVSRVNNETEMAIFGVSLFFVTRIDGLEFDPAAVSLLIPGLVEMKPAQFYLKSTGNNSGLDIWDCGHYRYPPADFGSGPRYVVRSGLCVDLFFDVSPPSPETEFVLRIPAFARNEEELRVPDLRFKKGTVRIVDFPIR
jgi:hypothetical protein